MAGLEFEIIMNTKVYEIMPRVCGTKNFGGTKWSLVLEFLYYILLVVPVNISKKVSLETASNVHTKWPEKLQAWINTELLKNTLP